MLARRELQLGDITDRAPGAELDELGAVNAHATPRLEPGLEVSERCLDQMFDAIDDERRVLLVGAKPGDRADRHDRDHLAGPRGDPWRRRRRRPPRSGFAPLERACELVGGDGLQQVVDRCGIELGRLRTRRARCRDDRGSLAELAGERDAIAAGIRMSSNTTSGLASRIKARAASAEHRVPDRTATCSTSSRRIRRRASGSSSTMTIRSVTSLRPLFRLWPGGNTTSERQPVPIGPTVNAAPSPCASSSRLQYSESAARGGGVAHPCAAVRAAHSSTASVAIATRHDDDLVAPSRAPDLHSRSRRAAGAQAAGHATARSVASVLEPPHEADLRRAWSASTSR